MDGRCEEIRGRLEAFSTGEIESCFVGPVAGHLESCGDCRRAFDRLRGLAALLRGAPVPPAPEGLATRILAKADAPSGFGRRASLPVLRRAAAILFASVGLMTGSLMGWHAAGGPSAQDSLTPPYGELLTPLPESSAVRAYLFLLDGVERRP